ncbi:GuaB3 family IMP dehydrogenase-related protein [Corynebacterium aquatimens]|uniref:GuaB3 family IMP dehydrogenase-related protein n=1 Tax=Corynebacterium TaxID=1716 RepID=UPI001F1C62BE|nr:MULTISPECIES: GuaB3 family IMP dehydrogenase-related protein [Corynebacterium]QYH20211.1 GuaB3 family IMP dehydrogenase-related protein [Corynebacterium aquatimens]UIZ92528.1 GuaB3 family IMP dehydrogenase-related protein [Corynebacterium sp. CNCTC7651]
MREYVEIGIGREARKAYDLSDIAVVPKRRTRSSKLVDTTWHFDAYSFDLPLLSHPTDALASPEFVIEMGKLGGLGVIDAEGLWGRQADLEGAIAQVVEAAESPMFPRDDEDFKAYRDSFANATSALQKLHADELDRDLLTERIQQVRDSGVTVAVRVSAQNARELAPVVIAAGAEILFIQGSIVSAEHVQEGGEPLNLKEFVGTLDVPVIAGGVFDYATATHLMRAGVAGVIVGSGATGSHALGVPLATAIADVAAARRAYLDETEGRYVHVVADAEVYTASEIAVALACGADAVMVGRPLARAHEAPASGTYWEPQAAHPRFPRGTVSSNPYDSRQPLHVVLEGPSSEPDGGLNLVGGLRRIMAKCGYTDLKQFQKADLVVTNF